ncbi:MAG: demethoxyubiquinone hydroxylase family protein [Hydrotalea sp.]|nr:demethoxyubiquinone hydroxylase family protein [Hydrotalea sp.]
MAYDQQPFYLPGDRKNKHDLSPLYRVDQAGELGAVQIYSGQMRGVKNPNANTRALLAEMKEHEEEHFGEFNRLISTHQTRPSFFYPIWKRLGFAVGFLTARSGIPSAMSLTVAVEDEINEHYLEQLATLDPASPLWQKIEKFRQDELLHRDTALEQGAKEMKFYQTFYPLVRRVSRLAINIAKKI